MSKKTNKTSHVMDLLTNGASADADSPVAEAVSNQEKKVSDVQSTTVTPAKVTVVDEGSRNDRLSQEILGKLTEELEEETRQDLESGETAAIIEVEPEETVEKPAPDVTQEISSPYPDDTDVSQITDSQPTDIGDVTDPETDAPQPPKANVQDHIEAENVKTTPKIERHPIIPESQFSDRFADKEYRFINVMEQLLMRQNLEAVLTQYDVCTCPRCMSDVCALVLTGLPSKYVVTSRDSISPLISYYENKYKISVLTELMKACDRVRQNPRHKVSH